MPDPTPRAPGAGAAGDRPGGPPVVPPAAPRDSADGPPGRLPHAPLDEAVARRVERRRRAEREAHRGIWASLGLFGIVGWSVSVPTLAGLALGVWLDGRFDGRISWTVTLLFVGIVLGCLNAWRWVRHESEDNGHEPRS